MNNQQILSKLLVEELRKRGVLEDIICENEIESLRVCNYCGRLMNEGWMYGGYETYCSNKCMMSSHPDEDLKDIRKHACDEDSDTYWTAWEG